MDEDTALGSVETASLLVRGAGRGTITGTGPSAMARKEIAPSFPTTWEKRDAPIITGDADTHDQAGFPSLFHAGRYLDSPLGEWYCYWSGHDGGGIRLHHADNLLGEWTAHDGNPLFDVNDVGGGDHVASPSAVWDPRRDRLNLYYHRGHPGSRAHSRFRQETELATSSDGVSFTKRSSVLRCRFDGSWDEQERSYLRVRRVGEAYVGVYQGRDDANNNPGIGYAWSHDGTSWETLPHPLWHNRHIEDYDPRAFQHGSPALTTFGGSTFVLLSYGGPTERAISAVRLDSPDAWSGSPVPVLSSSEPWESAVLEAPTAYYHAHRLFLFYGSQDPATSDRSIGVAYCDLEAY